MKSSKPQSRYAAVSALWSFIALAIVCVAATAAGSTTNQSAAAGNLKTNSIASSNAAPAELPIPLSEFDVTLKPTKDPFFPNSLRQAVPVITTNTGPAYDLASFQLKALSGTKTEPLAIINNRTFAVGETNEVTTVTGGKMKIKCVEIKPTSVVIVADGHIEPLEIFLRKIVQ